MTDTSLVMLCQQIRRDTLRLLAAFDEGCLRFAPTGTSNHVIWHCGHAVWLQDVLCLQLLDQPSALPDGWADTYGMNCQPVGDRSQWPSREEMTAQLSQQQDRLVAVLSAATATQLDRVADPQRGPLTVRSRIVHGFHDEARHAGEMCLLAKLYRIAQSD